MNSIDVKANLVKDAHKALKLKIRVNYLHDDNNHEIVYLLSPYYTLRLNQKQSDYFKEEVHRLINDFNLKTQTAKLAVAYRYKIHKKQRKI